MEEEVIGREVVVSASFEKHRKEIYLFTVDKFGYFQAELYDNHIEQSLNTLSVYSAVYPECRFLATTNKTYRNIILDAHLIIYRIMAKRIEVLDIIASSIKRIRKIRRMNL